jgi:hypothetical protein
MQRLTESRFLAQLQAHNSVYRGRQTNLKKDQFGKDRSEKINPKNVRFQRRFPYV